MHRRNTHRINDGGHLLHFFLTKKGLAMNITLNLIPIVSLLAGILIFIMPRLLSTIVAIYLIMVGLVGLFGSGNFLR